MGVLSCGCARQSDDLKTSFKSFSQWQQVKDMPDSTDKRIEIRKIFELIDTNHDETISKNEFRAFVKAVHSLEKNDRVRLIADKLFKQIDEDESDQIDFNEF